MATHTMHGNMMIFLSPRVHEQNKQSRDAITTDARRAVLATLDHVWGLGTTVDYLRARGGLAKHSAHSRIILPGMGTSIAR